MTIIDISESVNTGKAEYIKCPKCHSDLIRLNGYVLKSDGRRVQRFQCRDCGYTFTLERKKKRPKKKRTRKA